MQDRKFGRASAVSRKPGKGGRRLKPCGSRANFCRHTHDVHTGNAEENLPGYLFSRKAMANTVQAEARAPAAGREILPEYPDIYSGVRRCQKKTVRLYGDMGRSDRPTQLWAMGMRFFGPPPTMGNGPRRTRRLRLAPQHGIRPGRIPIRCEALRFAEILPPDASGKSRVKPSSGGLGGGGQYLCALNRPLRTLCDFQRSPARRMPGRNPPAPPVEKAPSSG